MIIVKLYGGLGNQMYQYAAGTALAERLNTHLYLDLSWFEEVKKQPELTLRWYELGGFGIEPEPIRPRDKLHLKLHPATIFKEERFEFMESFNHLKGNVILDGYWQSYKYFEKFNHSIVDAFKFPVKPEGGNKQLMESMSESESVLVHVRRGDYNTQRGKEFHGLIPMDYYTQAVSDIAKRLGKPIKLFVFSDEIDWCKENLEFDHPMVFVDSNGPNTGPEDMQLMSSCKHMIIANSSFSWWAAWLNQNPGKIIYAPRAWFKGVTHEINDRIPEDWFLL